MPGEQGAFQMGEDGVVEAHDAGEPRLSGPETGQKVLADLGLYRTVDMAARAKLAQSTWLWDLRHGIEPTSPKPEPALLSGFRILTIV
ncbi:hypothetical protein GCM10023075_15930 [Streptosporangium album]